MYVKITEELEGLLFIRLYEVLLEWEKYLELLFIDLMQCRRHLLWVLVHFAAQICLHVCVLGDLCRVAHARAREDIIDEVLRVVVVRAPVCVETERLEIPRLLSLYAEMEVLSKHVQNVGPGWVVRSLHSIIEKIEVAQEVLEKYVVFRFENIVDMPVQQHQTPRDYI